ncbi:MAG: hypothetical protein HYU66_15530 [Armatimonadetes bacterium]|nr:hypothetical protein [Armatimonadota bacterium]
MKLCVCCSSLLLLVSLGLSGCDPTKAIDIEKPSPPIYWFIGVDLTASTSGTVGPQWLNTVEHEMIPAVVLSRVHEGDWVFTARITGRLAEQDAQAYHMVATGLDSVGPTLAKVRDELWGWKQLGPETKGSNFGACVRWIAANAAQAEHDPGGGRPQIVACLFTDGCADGWQAPDGGDRLPADTELWIWGTAKRHDKGLDDDLDHVLAKAGADPDQVQRVPFCDWQFRSQNWRSDRHLDQGLLELLKTGKPVRARELLRAG